MVKFKDFISNPVTILTLLTGVIIGVITFQNLVLSDFGYETQMGSFYNNYLIFKNSFFHLLDNHNLYVLYREVQTDLYKYSPTFALGFGFFAYLPDWLGLVLWNSVNALVFYALWQMKLPLVRRKYVVWLFVLLEFVTNIQSSQSNGLMAGLMILAYVFLERKNVLLATLMVVLSIYLKLFGAVAFALFLFYPDKVKAIGYTLLWMVIFYGLPLLVVSPDELIMQYGNWIELLKNDKPVAFSLSVMGWLKYWFDLVPSGSLLTAIGIVVFLIPLVQIKKYSNPVFRQLILASVLIWVVLFNHKAESPTFIIAMAGVAIWYFAQPKNTVNLILLIFVLVFSQLAPSDLYPKSIRDSFFVPYVIKVFPVILVWMKLLYDTIWRVKVLEVKPSS
ncbi:MAG: hypothetical protein ACI9GM_000933 [Salibacteraceae bacterium]|jgi:hypothetical protein